MTDNEASKPAVRIERSFDAPVDLIWQMWTEPEHFAVWYGPDGATIPVAKMDVRVGGSRLVCMEVQTPYGAVEMCFTGEYREVVANMGMPDGHPATTEVRVELENVGGRTRLVLTHAGIQADSPGAAGWTMALDKLGAHIRRMGSDQN